MLRAATIAVGDELLDGRVLDTNSAMISGALTAGGIAVVRSLVTGDPLADIVRCLEFALEDADVVIVTGGIGPTEDDRTRHAVAAVAGDELIEDAAQWSTISAFIKSRGFPVHESNRRQAWFPRHAEVLPNLAGTAPGFVTKVTGDKRVFVLPGPPSEARVMLENEVLPRLGLDAERPSFRQTTLCFTGVTESHLGGLLAELLVERPDIRVGITSAWGLLRVTARAPSHNVLEQTLATIRTVGQAWILGEGYREVEDLLGERLIERGLTVALAESLTAGLATARLGRVPGISAALLESVVTYSNESKTARLGVPPELIATHGAVSEECARAMAIGIAETSGARLAGSVTGIAGPTGGSSEKPVGLVWIATSLDGEVLARKRRYGDIGRDLIRERSAADLLLALLQRLQLQQARG